MIARMTVTDLLKRVASLEGALHEIKILCDEECFCYTAENVHEVASRALGMEQPKAPITIELVNGHKPRHGFIAQRAKEEK